MLNQIFRDRTAENLLLPIYFYSTLIRKLKNPAGRD